MFPQRRSFRDGQLLAGGPFVHGKAATDALAALSADMLGRFSAIRPESFTVESGAVAEQRCLITGYAINQATSGARPLYTPNGFNGAPSFSYDGIDDCLVGVNHPYPLGSFEVWKLISQGGAPADTTQRYAVGMGTGSGQGATISRVVSGGVNRIRATVGNGSAGVPANNLGVDFSTRHVARMIVSPTGVIQMIDGVTIAEVAVVPALTNARFRLGAFINTLPGNFYIGHMAETIITPLLNPAKAAQFDAVLMPRRNL